MGMKWQKITGTTTLAAPADFFWVSGCAGGSGGGGGDPTPGGGGGGGGAGQAVNMQPFRATLGETLTATIGAYGAGGPAGNNGSNGGDTSLSGASDYIKLYAGQGGLKGNGTTGGNGGSWYSGSAINGPPGGANGVAGSHSNGSQYYGGIAANWHYQTPYLAALARFSCGGGGGGLNANGGMGISASGAYEFNGFAGSGNASGGGGGGGGCTPWGKGGTGGSYGGAGSAPAAGQYGAGGGGGSGASAGANGSSGVLFLIWLEPDWTASAMLLAIGMASGNLDMQLSTTNTLLTSTGIKVATNADKTGYSLSSAGVQAIWDALTSALSAVGSIGKRIVDYLDASVSSRSTYAGGDTSGTTTLLSRIVGTLASGTHQPQSGDAYARLGAPNGASVVADVTAVGAAVLALHDFDPATDTVAHVTLVDTVTTLTNRPDVPTEAEIADAVRVELEPELASITAMAARMEEQVPDGPVLVIAAPAAGQTTVWISCHDPYGVPEADVKISLRCIKNALGGAMDSAPITMTSNPEGLASTQIPRGVGATYLVSRGSGGSVTFNGVDEETLELPPLLGAP